MCSEFTMSMSFKWLLQRWGTGLGLLIVAIFNATLVHHEEEKTGIQWCRPVNSLRHPSSSAGQRPRPPPQMESVDDRMESS